MPKKHLTLKELFYVISVSSIFVLSTLLVFYLLNISVRYFNLYKYQDKINIAVCIILLFSLYYGVAINGMKHFFCKTYEETYYPQHYLSIVLIALGLAFFVLRLFHITVPFILSPISNSIIFLIAGVCLHGNAKDIATKFENDKFITY